MTGLSSMSSILCPSHSAGLAPPARGLVSCFGRARPALRLGPPSPVSKWLFEGPGTADNGRFSILHRAADDLLDGRDALLDLGDPRHAQALHAFANSLSLDLHARRAVQDELADPVGDGEHLVERHAASVPRVGAVGAAYALV